MYDERCTDQRAGGERARAGRKRECRSIAAGGVHA